jgi:ectoine hydroxylase-related dioxygenase (phytanoyl-CoA dioxygenase family)
MALRQLPADSPIEDILSVLEEDGGLILKDFVSVEVLQTIATELKPFEQPDQVWKGNFFPEATKRICGTVGKSKTLASQLLLHPVYREICLRTLTMTKKLRYGEALREFKCYPVANASTTFDIGPGADAQQLHRDDGVHHLSHPNKQPHMIGLLVAETKTTTENGATVVIPGSHKLVSILQFKKRISSNSSQGDWDDRHPKPEETTPACLDPGDALLFDGAVFHGGGANVTKSERRKVHGVFMIRGNLRPEENTYLSFPPEIAKGYPDEVLEAYGYEIQSFLFSTFCPKEWEEVFRLRDICT